MALAFDLDVSNINSLNNLSEALVSVGTNGLTGDLFMPFSSRRLINTANIPDIFPTGEYIIRKGMYVNGTFLFVGSYKAYCRDLFGAGNNGYAWDGFLLGIRGYNTTVRGLLDEIPSLGTFFGVGTGFLPFRMMYEVNPGPIGSATAIANDSEVGLYGIDFYKNVESFSVLGNEFDISLILCGFQRIDPTVEGVPTGSDYVGNIYLGRFLKFLDAANDGIDFGQAFYMCDREDIMQVTWKATAAGHTDNTKENGRFGSIHDLNEWLGIVEEASQAGGDIWNFEQWITVFGTKPDTKKNAVDCNFFPRRFYDVTCISQQPYNTNSTANSPFLITGDAALDTDNDGDIDKTVPCIINGCFPYFDFINSPDFRNISAPYLSMNPSGATSLSFTNYTWLLEATTPTYNLDGAVAVFCSLPYEAVDLSLPYDPTLFPITLVAVNDVSYDGGTYGSIYGFEESLLYQAQRIFPLATEGGTMTATTGIQLPTRWYGKAVQQRTFTITEEDFGKQGTLDRESGEFTPNIIDGEPTLYPSIYDNDAKEYIGYNGNYQRYGAFIIDPIVNEEPTAVPGQLTGAGYGFLGIRDGVGAIAVMFDSGSPNFNYIPANPTATCSMVVRAEGSNISNNIVTNPSSATRKIVNCGWDNDRDQWVFIASDTNQVSVISVSSDFNTDTNNLGFLDQTDNFLGIEANTDSAMYFPISMSNSLDGWVWFGDLESNGFGIQPTNYGTVQSITALPGTPNAITYNAYPNSTTQVRRIAGTTGRSARVWVDYILFDGADAIIANKIKERGMKVSIEAVEWFKRTIIQTGDLNITDEEIEMWMRDQQDEYKQTLKEIERQGRVRLKKKQVSAYTEGIEEQINPDFMDTEVQEFMGTFTPETRPPTPEEARIERKKKGGYSPEQGSYYDEVFED